ncbi:hypothetical protein LCY76_03605 [Fictibacillus sp. KIGAM418]|uniref:DUF4083 domain-containing protein n=1 Tax=Fictibacillus marinisediminis TaxID=2878389 RepID=A0A9X1X897_9BACL|nr:hypothetical protein [Fictibacillus marinisediminis]MCK6255708.1 hypothetical protein [Fictibacillus marinisediminis]
MDMMQSNDPFDALGVFFGLFGVLYVLVALFMVVLTIVFIFKAMGFMKRKNEADRLTNEKLERLIHLQSKREIDPYMVQD